MKNKDPRAKDVNPLSKSALSSGGDNDHRKSVFFSSTAIYLISNILNAIVPFALLPVLTRYLQPEEYGQLAMFQTLLAVLSAIVGLNVIGAANRKFYDSGVSKEELADFILTCLQITLISTLLVALSVIFTSELLSAWLGIERSWVLLAPVVSAAAFVSMLRLGQWQIRGQAFRYGIFQVLQGSVGMGLSLLLVVGLTLGVAGRAYALIWVPPVFGVVALIFLFKDKLLPKKPTWRLDQFREALSFGVPLIPHVAGTLLLGVADRLVVNDKLGIAQAGLYMVAAQLALVVPVVMDAINRAYVPWLYERLLSNKASELRDVVRLSYCLAAALIFGASAAFLMGPELVQIVAGEQYREAGSAFAWLVLGNAFGGMTGLMSHYILFARRTGMLSITTAASGVLNIALLLVLVRGYGITGAAIAFAVSMAVRFVMTWIAAQRCFAMPWLLDRNRVDG